ncbi:MAG: hypothetical protein HVN35_06125 [Methanobacteriaceae archaeon]|nr:hypothetical protein [Methanobacteriaceae archaeon]
MGYGSVECSGQGGLATATSSCDKDEFTLSDFEVNIFKDWLLAMRVTVS